MACALVLIFLLSGSAFSGSTGPLSHRALSSIPVVLHGSLISPSSDVDLPRVPLASWPMRPLVKQRAHHENKGGRISFAPSTAVTWIGCCGECSHLPFHEHNSKSGRAFHFLTTPLLYHFSVIRL